MSEFYDRRNDEILDRLTTHDKIYLYRKQRGLKQAELAALAGISTPTLRGYERGRIVPSSSRINDIAAALKIDPDMLMESDHLDPIPKTIKGDSFDTSQELTEALDRVRSSIAPRFSINSVTKAGGGVTYKVSCNEVPVTDMVYNIIRLTNGEALQDIYQGIEKASYD